jgi:hypothetical protein
MLLCWTVANWISFWGLILSLVTAAFLIANFFISRKITSTSLAINQFNIYNDEIKSFKEEAKNIKFEQKFKYSMITPEDFNKSNGVSYIVLFTFATDENIIRNHNPDITLDPNYLDISLFRSSVIFPLERFYAKLSHLLEKILKDEILLKEYKAILFSRIERDLLQDYFRICNYEFLKRKLYNLAIFKSQGYDANKFYKINEFYITNNLFDYENLKFYKATN